MVEGLVELVMYFNPVLEHPESQDIATLSSLMRNAFTSGFWWPGDVMLWGWNLGVAMASHIHTLGYSEGIKRATRSAFQSLPDAGFTLRIIINRSSINN